MLRAAILKLAGYAWLAILCAVLCSAQTQSRPANCEAGQSDEEQSADSPYLPIKFEQVTFKSDQGLPAIADQIASEIKAMTTFTSGPDWALGVNSTVRELWQRHGYFNVVIDDEKTEWETLEDYPNDKLEHDNISISVSTGRQYRTGDIIFSRNREFHSSQLRSLFPIQEGEIFNLSKVEEGVQALRAAYGERGFIQVKTEPRIQINEDQGKVSYTVEIDEGPQFKIGKFEIFGLDPVLAQALKAGSGLEPDKIFNARRLADLFEKNKPVLPADWIPDLNSRLTLHEPNGIVDLRIDYFGCLWADELRR